LSALSIALGTLVLGALVWWIDRMRDTDRADARADVTSTFKQDAIARETPIRFTDVTASAGLQLSSADYHRHRALPEDNGSGLAWGDYDGDGYMDLYVVRHAGVVPAPGKKLPPGNRLFRNNSDGTFTDTTARAGVADQDGFGMGATWVDFDDDGLLDLYVTNRGPNRLYKNKGDGTFVDVAAQAGVADPLWGTGTTWGDFDHDGHIDFYLCNYVDYDSVGREPTVSTSKANSAGSYEAPYTLNPNSYDPQPNRLFRNRGDGTFEDVTARCDVANPDGRSLAATFVDLDGDGWLDLYVNNDVSPDRLYRNSGADFGPESPITFFELSAVAGTADSRGSMGLSVGEIGDLNGAADGLPDLFITHWVTQENAFYQSLVTPSGKLEYRDKARQFRLGEISIDRVGWGCALTDLDLDGRVDIAVANGSTLEQNDNPLLLKPEPMFLFINDGTGFRDVAPLAGEATALAYNARGLAVADFNNDGYPDIALSTNEGEVRLLRNDTHNGNRSLTVMLNGRAAYCFGAKIEVWAGGHCQYRWREADVSYLSQHAPPLIFGLGKASVAEKVLVRWADGKTSTLTNVPAGVVRIDHASAMSAP
jgi:hypothetical protein